MIKQICTAILASLTLAVGAVERETFPVETLTTASATR